jgi:pimeloyl-ACP methyl ester carboxylesterase
MTPAELRAATRLGGHAFSGFVSRVEQVHQAVASRAFGPVGQPGAPVRIVHDAIAGSTYLAVRGAGRAAGTISGAVASLIAADGRPAASARAGNLALGALHAVAGDRLGPDLAPLVIGMAVRVAGRDLELTAAELAAAFPDATPRMAVFVHGLAETENSWQRGDRQCEPYGRRLRAEFGYTPVYVRYNTGRHISENGADLAGLLDRVVSAWPVQLDELVLVGHSMGGLVIRSACHQSEHNPGGQEISEWARLVSHVFYLGSPHLGAPLARAAGFAGAAMARAAETMPFATMVNGTSAGIKDLRYGYLLAADWDGCDLDTCLRDHRSDTPLLGRAGHHNISATVTADPASPLGAVAGDLLVQPASAHGHRGPGQRIGFAAGSGRGLGGMHHLDLLNHPAVWTAMRGILAAAAP